MWCERQATEALEQLNVLRETVRDLGLDLPEDEERYHGPVVDAYRRKCWKSYEKAVSDWTEGIMLP